MPWRAPASSSPAGGACGIRPCACRSGAGATTAPRATGQRRGVRPLSCAGRGGVRRRHRWLLRRAARRPRRHPRSGPRARRRARRAAQLRRLGAPAQGAGPAGALPGGPRPGAARPVVRRRRHRLRRGRPAEALRRLRPDVWAKGGDYEDADLPEAGLVRSWGGRVVLLPYLSGRSTTAVLQSIPAGENPVTSNHVPLRTAHRRRHRLRDRRVQRPRRRRRRRRRQGRRHAGRHRPQPARGRRRRPRRRRPVRLRRGGGGRRAAGRAGRAARRRRDRRRHRRVRSAVRGVDRGLGAGRAGQPVRHRRCRPGRAATPRGSAHGRVVTVASTLGLKAVGDATAYCASKFGVVGFTRALATELAGRVGVTLLVPGGMRTRFFDGRTEQYRPGPDAPLNDPEDVAATVLMALQQPPGCEVRELVVAVVDGAVLAVTERRWSCGPSGSATCSPRSPALRGLRRAWPGARLVLAAPAGLGGWLAVARGGRRRRGGARTSGRGAGLADRAGAPEVAVNLHGRGPAEPPAARAGCDPAAGRVRLPRGRLRRRAAVARRGARGRPVDPAVAVGRWGRRGRRPAAAAAGRAVEHVVVHPGAASRVPPLAAGALGRGRGGPGRRGHRVVVTGTRGEADALRDGGAAAPGVEDHCGRHDLPGSAAWSAPRRLLLSGDTGVAHVATAFGTPSVTLFGPVSPALWGPARRPAPAPGALARATATDPATRRATRTALAPRRRGWRRRRGR